MRKILMVALLGCCLGPASAGAGPDRYVAVLGGALAGPETGFLGGALELYREEANHAYGLEIGYGGAANARIRPMRIAIFPPVVTESSVLHSHLASILIVGKIMTTNPGGGAHLVLSAGAGIQDRMIWGASAGVLGPDHEVRPMVALSLGLEGAARVAPRVMFRVATLASDTGTAPAVGILAGVGFRP